MKVLLVGAGGREHALAWKLTQSPLLDELHAAPGNPGIATLGTCHPIHAEDSDSLLELCRALEIDLVVVGPEAPLVAGAGDRLRHAGVRVFGPSGAAARIEGSKAFAKDVLTSAGVPTAERLPVARPPCVVKVDGLAGGKGVFVCRTQEELDAGLREASAHDGPLVIEELLEGDELSVFAVCDGTDAVGLPAAQDFKRAGEGDEGPNTGGMGSFSPVPGFDAAAVDELVATVHRPVLAELERRGAPFVGLLYAGLILTDSGPRVLEFNCRFGDPETQSILPRLDGDLLPALAAAADRDLREVDVSAGGAAVTVVLAARDYPDRGDSGTPIEGVEAAEERGALVFHGGTALHGDRLVTNGGRILNVVGTGASVGEARDAAYAAVAEIRFDGLRARSDIAARAAAVVGG
jgi:phosphoribosylamine--glycine ligase